MEEPAPVEKSPLDKPLGELTEDDIAQVTREDCRRFLKEKGMRRPSWNKSQAIQQVVSLKALFEVRNDDDAGDDDEKAGGASSSSTKRQRKEDNDDSGHVPVHQVQQKPPDPPPSVSPVPLLSSPSPPQQQQKDASSDWRRVLLPSPPSLFPMASPEIAGVSSRAASDPAVATTSTTGQMTIFYGGKVNVFDGVPTEKALVIMRLAAKRDYYNALPNSSVDLNRPFNLPQLNPVQTIAPCPPPPPTMVFATTAMASMTPVRFSQYPRDGVERRNFRELEPEGPTCRKASLQRYLEKRKDRRTFKYKKNMEGFSSSNMDLYLTQKFRYQNPNGQQCQSDISSPHPKPPRTPTRCNSFENQTQNLCFSFDLNDDDVQEI